MGPSVFVTSSQGMQVLLVQVLQEGGPCQGPKGGPCLAFRNELSEETHVLMKPEALLGRGTQVESSRLREPRTDLPRGSQSLCIADPVHSANCLGVHTVC